MRLTLDNMTQYTFDDKYEADSTGSVWVKNTGKQLKPFTNRYGYVEYVLTDRTGIRKHIQAHRIVACLFLPLDISKLQVNHIDGIKTNNTLPNLEWCTPSENERHSIDILGKTPWNKNKSLPSGYDYTGTIRAVERLDLDGNHEHTYFNPKEAEADGYKLKQISAVCRGSQRTHNKKLWRYKDSEFNGLTREPKIKTPGITPRKDTGKYTVRITYDKKVYRVGSYSNISESIIAHNKFLMDNPHIKKPLIKEVT